MRDGPASFEVTAILDPRPRYAGTSHDDATARAMGFRAALLPGVFVYGHATRMALMWWGEDWLARGRAQARFRRPVHAGDRLLVERGAVERDVDGQTAKVSVANVGTGEVVLDGTIGLPDAAPEAPANLPLVPTLEPRLELQAGTAEAGVQLGSEANVLTREIVEESLADFHETEPTFVDLGLVHSGCLIRRTMGDALGNLILPMPVIFAGIEVQHLAPVPVGSVCRTSSRITRVWETRGRHFFETEEWLIGNGRPVARHLRQNLYAMID